MPYTKWLVSAHKLAGRPPSARHRYKERLVNTEITARVDIEGVYTLEFASNLGFRGSGLVTLQDGHFRGNNASFE